MTLRNAGGLGRDFEGAHRKDESRIFHSDLFSPLGMEQR